MRPSKEKIRFILESKKQYEKVATLMDGSLLAI